MSATDNDNVKAQDNDSEEFMKFLAAVGVYFGWFFLVVIPIATLMGEFKGVALVRALLSVSGVAVSWFLIFSSSGPGIDGVKMAVRTFFSPIRAIPERVRLIFMLPVFTVALLYSLTTLTWLVSSDEASQKRALFASYDRAATSQWFHHGDSIDIYVYSETLSSLHEKHVKGDPQKNMVGVKITYSGDAMKKSGRDFRDMVRHDIALARVGKTGSIHGEATLGVYETKMRPFDFVQYHGAFGINGHGPLEILFMFLSLVFCAVFLAIKGRGALTSSRLLIASAVLIVLASSPYVMQQTSDMPEQVSLIQQVERSADL